MSQSALYTQSLTPRVDHNVVISTLNASTANLAASATFTGTGEAFAYAAAVVVSFKADQNCTIYIDQSPDNTNWDVSDQYDFNVVEDNFSRAVARAGNYFRVRVTNASTTTATTYLRLTTLIVPIAAALPRALDVDGNLEVSVQSIEDKTGNQTRVTQMGEMSIAQTIRLVGAVFVGSADAIFWTVANSGAGSASTVASGLSTQTSGTAASGYGQIQSVAKARFVFGSLNRYRGTHRVTNTTVAHNTRRWGAFTTTSTTTPSNGFYFELSSAGILSVVRVSNGTPTAFASGSFNGKVTAYTLDTNVHDYEITYFVMSAQFFIDGVLIHEFEPTTAVLTQDLHLNVTATSINDGTGGTSGVLETWQATIQRLGPIQTQARSYYQTGTTAGVTLKVGPGQIKALAFAAVTIHSAVTLYDNTAASGTVLYATGGMPATTAPFSVAIDIPFTTGLTLVIATAACNLVVSYE